MNHSGLLHDAVLNLRIDSRPMAEPDIHRPCMACLVDLPRTALR